MITFGFFNNKGGVGKSTSSASVAAYISMRNKKDKGSKKKERKKVLLIDMDPQGNSTKNFFDKRAYKKEHTSKLLDMRDIFLSYEQRRKEFDLEPYIQHIHEYLDLIPATPLLELANRELLGKFKADFYLKTILSWIDSHYDYCVIDTPPNLSLITTNCLLACDYIFIPIKLGGYELDGFETLLTGIRDIEKLNDIRGVFITQYEANLNVNAPVEEVAMSILTEFEKENNIKLIDKIMNTKIRKNTNLNEANTIGIDIFNYKPGSSGSSDYAELSEEILELIRIGEEEKILAKKRELEFLKEQAKQQGINNLKDIENEITE